MAARIIRVAGISKRNRGDVVNQPGIDLAWAIIAVIWMPSKLTERVSRVDLLGAHQTRHQGRGAVDWLSGNRGTESRSRIAY